MKESLEMVFVKRHNSRDVKLLANYDIHAINKAHWFFNFRRVNLKK